MKNGRKILVTVLALMLMLAFLVSCDASKLLLGNKDGADSSDGSGANSGGNTDQNGGGNTNQDNGNADKNDEETKKKQTPVYQGMTITSSVSSATLSALNGSGDNGNHYGHYKGDHTGKDSNINQNNPYPDNSGDETLEEEVKASLEIVGPAEDIYYAEQNSDIYINIHINNPDSFEILSFTLNGKKYSDYMFEDGSDLEKIIIKYNVGNAHGVVDYTIDAIKYVDGEEIKDVIIAGDKTVKAGIRVENQVSAEINNVTVDTNSLSFDVKIKDEDGLVAYSDGILKAVIYDGDKIVSIKDLSVGENSVSFEGLETHSLYQYAVVGYYDDFSGVGAVATTLYKNAFYTEAIVLFDNITVGQDGITFGFDWLESFLNKEISVLKLYTGETLVKEIDASAVSIAELLSGTTYKLVAEYVNGTETESIYLEFTTLKKATPDFTIANTERTKDSLNFSISVTDTDSVGAITKVELIHGTEITTLENVTSHEIKNLLSDNGYILKVTYTYDLNDGEGNKTLEKKLLAKTDAKAAPIFTIGEPVVTVESIKADCQLTDSDSVITSYKVELYQGATLISENTEKKIEFTDLTAYTDYTVKITYTYDLSDGLGAVNKTVEKNVKTLPTVEVVECSLTTSDALFSGDTVKLQITVNNPAGVSINSVAINGESYDVLATTSNRIFVEIATAADYAGGETEYKIEGFGYTSGTKSYTAAFKTPFSHKVFINGVLKVVSFEIVDSELQPLESHSWIFPSKEVFCLITLDNPTGYIIDSFASYTKIDDNRYYFKPDDWVSWSEHIELGKIEYHNDKVRETLWSYITPQNPVYMVRSDEIKYISTPDDLKNMYSGYYYELKNDIDLSGLACSGVSLEGIFDGKGYSIKNMTSVGGYYCGLFGNSCGRIMNVNIEKATLIAKKGDYYGDGSCGGLISYLQCDYYVEGVDTGGASYDLDPFFTRIIIENCSVDEESILTGTYAGGIVGFTEAPIVIKNCVNKAAVSATRSAGGILGQEYIYDVGKIEIIDSQNYGVIISEEFAAGIANFLGGTANVIVENCTNYGTVTARQLEGVSYYGETEVSACGISYGGKVIGCVNNGAVSAKHTQTDAFMLGGAYASGISRNANVLNCVNNGAVSTSSVSGYACSGGIVADYDGTLEACVNTGRISAASSGDSRAAYAGGIAGRIRRNINILNCFNIGDISAEYTGNTSDRWGGASTGAVAGGIIGGETEYSINPSIQNCFNAGNISVTTTLDTAGKYCGAICGGSDGGLIISNCVNTGIVTPTIKVSGKDAIMGFGGFPKNATSSGIKAENCYSVSQNTETKFYECEVCGEEELNSKDFYTETLGWSEEIWDFSELDVENGKYPKLK